MRDNPDTDLSCLIEQIYNLLSVLVFHLKWKDLIEILRVKLRELRFRI